MTDAAGTDTENLFTPLTVGAIEAPNRVWMAPLTRNRAHSDGTPHVLAATYYEQRASAGLIITEATQISAAGKGYLDTPGIHTQSHIDAWKPVTEAVHSAGGRIFLQLWHVGRISHTSLLPEGTVPVAPSAIRANAQTFNQDGFVDVSEPRALATDEIPQLIEDYRQAALNAIEAGFDGVEVHAANGYLLDQFLHASTNQRTDAYGGSPENRARLTLEVTKAVADAIGADRVGIRLSPTGTFNDMQREGSETTFAAVVDGLDALGLAYLHVVEKFAVDSVPAEDQAFLDDLRKRWSGIYVANGDFDAASGQDWIARGHAHAITFGRPFIANPDLPARYEQGTSLNEPDQATFYGGGHRGYIDYPSLAESERAA